MSNLRTNISFKLLKYILTEIASLKRLYEDVSNTNYEDLNLNNFSKLSGIPALPWSEGSDLVTFKNYDDGTVSGNYFLVKESLLSNWLGMYYLLNWEEVVVVYNDAISNTLLNFRLKITNELELENYRIFKVVGSTIKAADFEDFVDDTNGKFQRKILVTPLKM